MITKIYDGNSTFAPFVGVFTGASLPNNGYPMFSSGNSLLVVFTSDVIIPATGFIAVYSVGIFPFPKIAIYSI